MMRVYDTGHICYGIMRVQCWLGSYVQLIDLELSGHRANRSGPFLLGSIHVYLLGHLLGVSPIFQYEIFSS